MTALIIGSISGNKIALAEMADSFISQGFFRGRAGEYCSLLAIYRYSKRASVTATFVSIPYVGLAIYYYHDNKRALDLFVLDEYRNKGYGRRLMNELVRLYGDQIPIAGLKTQEPTTRLLTEARAKYSQKEVVGEENAEF